MSDILISIIIPCYNQANYLPDSLNSVLSQTYQKWEALVVNDGSSDDTEQVAKIYAEKDTRIRYIFRENGGLSAARNTAISFAKGEIITLLDADDIYCCDYLTAVAEAHLNGSLLTFSGYSYFGDSLIIHQENLIKSYNISKAVLLSNILPPVSVSIRKEILNITGNFDENLKSAEDWDLWIRCIKSGFQPFVIPKVLTKYRIVANSMSRNAPRMYNALKTVALRAVKKDFRLSADMPDNRDYPELDVRSGIQRSLAMCLGVSVMQGNLDEAISLYKKETAELNLEWTPDDFEPMCSYLSFRYRYSKEDINWLLRDIYPYFTDFFLRLGYKKSIQNACVKKVFMRHLKVKNKHSYGIWAQIINKLILND